MRLIDTDTVYRQDAVEALKNAEPLVRDFGYYKAIEAIRLLPSAKLEHKRGKWIKISPANIYECSECGKNVMTHDIDVYDFCHGCGSYNGGGQNETD